MQRVIAKIEHDKLVPFLKEQMPIISVWGLVYWFFNLLCIGATIYYCVNFNASLDAMMSGVGLGFASFILLLPIHEGIHALAYKMIGAPKVSFGGDWKKGIAYAIADKFVVAYQPFLLVALAPFIAINGLLIVTFIFNSSISKLVILGALILHTAGCFGDFALVNFMQKHRHVNMMTMDSLEDKATYFYEGTGEL